VGLLVLFTDFECKLPLNPFEFSNRLISSLGLRVMLILVVLLNYPAVRAS